MNKYYIQRISAETCEDIIKKYQPKKQEDIIIDIILRRKEAEQVDKMAEDHNQ